MAAPTNAALVKKESPCQLGAVHTWPGVSLKCDAATFRIGSEADIAAGHATFVVGVRLS